MRLSLLLGLLGALGLEPSASLKAEDEGLLAFLETFCRKVPPLLYSTNLGSVISFHEWRWRVVVVESVFEKKGGGGVRTQNGV